MSKFASKTTRAPGLTAAMRRALELSTLDKWPSRSTLMELRERGLVDFTCWRGEYIRTPRGQAALAAPRMTAAELALLVYLDGSLAVIEKLYSPTWRSCERKDWIDYNNEYECWDLTPTGLTALNNMRAAMGSAEYRENLK